MPVLPYLLEFGKHLLIKLNKSSQILSFNLTNWMSTWMSSGKNISLIFTILFSKTFVAKRLTEFKTVSAVDVEVVIAWLPLAAERIENESVRAKFFSWHSICTFVIFVTLSDVLEGTVFLGTGERLGCKKMSSHYTVTTRYQGIQFRAHSIPVLSGSRHVINK